MNLVRKIKLEKLGIDTTYSLYEIEVMDFIDNFFKIIIPCISPYDYDVDSTIYYNDKNNGNTILIYDKINNSLASTLEWFWNPINEIENEYFKEENEYYAKILECSEGDIYLPGINPNHFVRRSGINNYLDMKYKEYVNKC